mmetsp:Transcript_895/g.2856  ORF Transcript_895/g.2856 Transcript_895/m.2856 type:complete len:450 (-) Transcript_895:265-1614(-)
MLRQAQQRLPAAPVRRLALCAVVGWAPALVRAASTSVPAPLDAEARQRARGAYFGALVADALCLGSHYEYDAKVIKSAYGGRPVDEYMAPGERMGGTTHGVGWGRRNYHPGQKKGDNTDYGLYTQLVLEYLAEHEAVPRRDASGKVKPIDLGKFLPVWSRRLETQWGAWKCTQTQQALKTSRGLLGRKDLDWDQEATVRQLGGMSNAMGLRSAAVLGVYEDEEDVALATRRVMFTHQNWEATEGGQFFARVAWRVVHKGLTPMEAIHAAVTGVDTKFSSHAEALAELRKPESWKAARIPHASWFTKLVRQGFDKCAEAMDPNSQLSKEEFVDDLAVTSLARLWEVGKSEPIKVGKASPTEGVLPASVYFLCKYQEEGFLKAAQANAMVGGDSASRAIAIGMVMGAYSKVGEPGVLPDNLRTGLNAWKPSEALLSKLALLQEERPKEQEL